MNSDRVNAAADAIAKAHGYTGGACLDEHYRDARVALHAADAIAAESNPVEDARAEALHDAFWAVHAGRIRGSGSAAVNTFYTGTNAAKRAIEELHGSPIVGPWLPARAAAAGAFNGSDRAGDDRAG